MDGVENSLPLYYLLPLYVCVCVFILNVTCHSTLPYLTYHISISDIKI